MTGSLTSPAVQGRAQDPAKAEFAPDGRSRRNVRFGG